MMDFVNCPECKSPVDLKSEIRYSPNKGVDIFHAPCYIARLTRERDGWKRRAAQHGCNVDGDDDDCG